MTHLLILYGMVIVWLLTGLPFIPKKEISSIGERIPWAIGFGGLLWGFGLFLYDLAGGVLSPKPLQIIALGIGLGGSIWTAFNTRRSSSDWQKWLRQPVSGLECAAWGILLLVFVTAVMESTVLPFYHVDAVTCFGVKAKALFLSGTFRIPFFYERGIVHAKPDYPLLVPYLESLYYMFCGTVEDIFVKQLFFVYAIFLIVLVFQGLRQGLDKRSSLIITAVFASIPLFLKDRDTQVVSGAADIVFMFYETAAVLAAVRWIETGSAGWRRLVVAGSLGCLLSKPQGLVFCGILWGMLWVHRDRRSWLIGAAQMVLFSLPWLVTARSLPRELTFPPMHFSKDLPMTILHRSPAVVKALLLEPWRISDWGLYWPVLIALFLFGRRPLNLSSRFIVVLVALQSLSYLGPYFVYPQSIEWWIHSSLTRWLTHGSALLLIAAAWSHAEQYVRPLPE